MSVCSRSASVQLMDNRPLLYLDHGLVLVLQPLVHEAVLLQRQQGQGALELTGLAL